jgi:hypothetical protein
MVANSVRVGGRDIAAVVHAIVRRAVKGSEKSSALFSTTTITIFRAYLKMSNGSQNMVELAHMNGVSYIAEYMVQVPITHSKRRLWMEHHVGPIHMICV